MKTRYSSKTNAELHFIIKDAGEAARNMRDINPVAEAKYLDQVNDACTELYRRRRTISDKLPAFSMRHDPRVHEIQEMDATLISAGFMH